MRSILFVIVAAASLAGTALAQLADEPANEPACSPSEKIGRFDPASDLLVANYDSKTDVDDLHSVAGLATVLADPAFACVKVLAVAGAYGDQEGDFISSPALFDLAFGDRWVDAHENRVAAVAIISASVVKTLKAGGDVWIAEAGQSNVSAEIVRTTMKLSPDSDVAARVHIVQHSDWNEEVTNPDDLAFVRQAADYIRIPDGNGAGNGSPGFRNEDDVFWPALLGDETVGAVWAEAKRHADEENGDPGYYNEAIGEGGLDFSDTAEISYIFGFDDMAGTEDFVDRFITGSAEGE